MNKVLNYFDGAFYINLDKRTERRESFETRTKNFGFLIERFSGIKLDDVDPRYCCTLSHIEVIKEAKKRGWKNCLIFEDDCKFSKNFLKTLESCVDFLRNNEWDLFYMGGAIQSNSKIVNDHIAECGGMYGTHAYAINERFYDRMIQLDFKSGVIDMVYIHTSDRKYFMTVEPIALQDSSFQSDLWWGAFVQRDKECLDSYKKYLNKEYLKFE